MDLIAVDIGNSNIALAVFVDDELKSTRRIDVQETAPLAETIKEFRALCGEQPLGARTVPVVVSSVNPETLKIFKKKVIETLDQNVLLIGKEVPLYIKLTPAIEEPEKVGTDRLLSAGAAFEVVENAVVVADFGTATTIDCVNQQGIFLGGAILPGLGLAAKTLHEHTAALPEVKPESVTGDYGTSTTTAIQQGIVHGAVGALQRLVERYATALGSWPQLVVTGGYGKLIAANCDFIDSLVPDLCLDGIFLAYKNHRAVQEQEISGQFEEFKKEFNLDLPDEEDHSK
jgi:type III pantothenate kinase